jgi:hypothetical protein
VAVSDEDTWFTYHYWQDDAFTPRLRPLRGYSLQIRLRYRELFFDPALPAPKMNIALRLLKKELGFRTLMDIIPLDASLVGGSHGHLPCRLA